MLPSEAQFAASMDALDITNDSAVVVYDGAGIFSAPRILWTFKAFGHSKYVSTSILMILAFSRVFGNQRTVSLRP